MDPKHSFIKGLHCILDSFSLCGISIHKLSCTVSGSRAAIYKKTKEMSILNGFSLFVNVGMYQGLAGQR